MPDILNPTNPNIQFFLSIDRLTILGQGKLQSVVFGGGNYSASNVMLSSLIFTVG